MEQNPKTILFIGLVYPEPGSSAAGTRMMQLLQLFLDNGYQVTFASAAQQSIHMANLSALGITVVPISLNSHSFDDFIKILNPQIVIFDRFMVEEQYGWRVAEVCPDALRVLDSEDLHCLRAARQHAVKKNRPFEIETIFAQDIAKREIGSILRCDLTLVISEHEMDLLQQVFRISAELLLYLPLFALKNNSIAEFAQRNDFVFIGNFLHEPNCDAVIYLKQNLWPKIRKKLPSVRLLVYGAYLPQKIAQFNNDATGFIICGRALDAADVLNSSRVLLAPLRFGAGIKGKLLEAMQSGTPSITSSIGAEGIAHNLPWAGAVSDDPDEFAEHAATIYEDEEKWSQAQQNGFKIIGGRFCKEHFVPTLLAKLAETARTLQNHRNRNFAGAVLLHHISASTKYMSKWIEAKNK